MKALKALVIITALLLSIQTAYAASSVTLAGADDKTIGTTDNPLIVSVGSNSTLGVPLTIGNATSGLYVGANGNVGIGTTAPNTPLTISIVGANQPISSINFTNANIIKDQQRWSGSGSNYWGWRETFTNNRYTFSSSNETILGSQGFTDSFTIRNSVGSYNVGIATTNPAAKLHVVGNTTIVGSSDVPQLMVQANPTQTAPIFEVRNDTGVGKVTVLANGNVGIDTTAPSAKLSIKAADSTPASGLFIGGAAGGAITMIGAGTDACYKLYITSTGTVATNVVTCPTAL